MTSILPFISLFFLSDPYFVYSEVKMEEHYYQSFPVDCPTDTAMFQK